MAVMGLRLAGRSNAVSQAARRGEPRDVRRPVARRPRRGDADHVGHQRRARADVGVGRDRRPVLPRYVLPEWDEAVAERVGSHRRRPRRRAVAGARSRAASGSSPSSGDRLRESALARGMSPSDVVWCDEVLDPQGAHRSASPAGSPPTSGPTLLLSQPDRLRALLLAGDRPVQFVFAGKAHPGRRDRQGDDPPDRHVRRRPRRPAPVRVPRGLRHRRRPGPVPGRRRVAEQPAATAGGVRHVAA